VWKVLDVLNWTADHLKKKGFDNPRLNAERLLAHILDVERVGLYLNYDRPLTVEEKAGFKECLRRRLRHEPLQYITGEVEFMSLRFQVTPAVLIPRPETEVLVEHAIEVCKSSFSSQDVMRCLDIGTGSGNIAISVAHYVVNAHVTAVESSESALAVARENAKSLGVQDKVTFKRASISDDQFLREVDGPFDLVLSNPPYVRSRDLLTLQDEIRHYEPIEALDGGEDGLDFYRRLTGLLLKLLAPDGAFFLEIGADQAGTVLALLKEAGVTKQEVIKDLGGHDRMVVGVNS
jgi:release factor glutamine methyltransferase